ncbi:Cupin domain protein [Aspergillus sclerotialis]|uniref:CENP-C homolog n=1 Tax=Aspergillus sclerotialis TaxID=2070753 RepID=A0A3A2Z4M4_9EURO|nr:Cupin domain protein [Aspergillus sclerotialis]
MAPRSSAKVRELDYSSVGKSGRRTGITLREGKRDEHGMEEIDGMFSSPEKSPIKENGFNHHGNETTIGSDGMSMDEGNAPEPVDFLNGVNGGRASYIPPPAVRSPTKIGLAGSPRRTPNLRSSSPQEPTSSPSSNRRPASRQDASLARRSTNTSTSNHAQHSRNKTKGTKNPSEPNVTVEFSDTDESNQLNGNDNADNFDQTQDGTVNGSDAGNNTVMATQSSPDINESNVESPLADIRNTEHIKPTSKTRKTAPDKNRSRGAPTQDESEEPRPSQKRKGRGRPPKDRQAADDEGDQRPSKKAKTSDHRTQHADGPVDPELDRVVENYANRTGPLKGRSLYILKREMPTDNSITHTRSGRVSIRPLAYWRNERCVYGREEAPEGQRYPLSTIKEIIRTEEREPEKTRSGKRRSKKSKSRKNADQDSENEDEESFDPWEKEGGVLHGYIRKWDPEAQAGTEEEEVLDIAYAPSGIETRDVKGSAFRFAKLLSSSFLGSGIVELPPGGVKKPKNSKKMHMVFYVCHGRVQIDISGVQFSAGKGCVFQIPRGNYYSFANTHETDARLFFTQGCVPVENDSSTPGEDSKVEQPEPPAKGARATAGKGRPRGKQKTGGSKS